MNGIQNQIRFVRPLIVLSIWAVSSAVLPTAPALGAQPPVSKVGGNPNLAVQKARQLEIVGRSREAEQLLQAALPAPGTQPDSPQLAGGLELLASIYFQSGRYDDARKVGLRCQRSLEGASSRDPTVVEKRQAIAVLLAEVALAREDMPDALKRVEQALALPAGLRRSDPLWEAQTCALKARVLQKKKDAATAGEVWSDVERRVRAALKQAGGGPRKNTTQEAQEAAARLLTEALIGQGQTDKAIAERRALLSRQRGDDAAAARNWTQIAACYAELGDDDGQERALSEAIALKAKQEKNLSSAKLVDLGVDGGQERTLREAIAQKAKREKDLISAEHADLLDRRAIVLDHRGKPDVARQLWAEAALKYEALVEPAATDDREIELQMEYRQALQNIYQQLGHWDDAIRVTRHLLDHREEKMLPDDPAIWQLKSALGALYGKVDDTRRARPLLTAAADYWRKRVPPAPMELAGTLNNLAEICRNHSGFAEALGYLEEAVPICERTYGGDDVRLAEAYSNLADVLSVQGRFRSAHERYQKVEEICRQGKDSTTARAKRLLASTLVNTAMLFKSQRQFTKAAKNCSDGLELQKALSGEGARELEPFYTALASLYLAIDQSNSGQKTTISPDLAQAAEYTQEAHDLCKKFNLEQPAGIIVLQLEAAIDLRKGDLESSKKKFTDACGPAHECRQPALEAKSLTYLAEIELRSGSAEPAAELAAKLAKDAIAILDQVRAYPNLRFMAYLTAARQGAKLNRGDEAFDLLGRAIKLIEAPRANTVGAESERAEYFSQFVAAFDLLVDWNVEEGKFDKALEAAEQGRNRTFRDQLLAEGVDFDKSLLGTPQASLLTQKKDVLSRYFKAQVALQQITAPEEVKDAVAAIESLEQEYAKIEAEIRDANPTYRDLLGTARQVQSWDEIAGSIVAPGNALVLYYLGHAKSHLFVIDGRHPDAPQHFPLEISKSLAGQQTEILSGPGPVTHPLIDQLVGADLEALRGGSLAMRQRSLLPGVVKIKTDLVDLSGYALSTKEQLALTEIVLPAAARDHIARLNVQNVVIVRDGALAQLPFESLLLSAEPQRFLLDDFPAITYAPSATILAMLASRKPNSTLTLLTVGDPAYRAPREIDLPEDSIDREFLAAEKTFLPLPATLEECRAAQEAMRAGSADADVAMFTGEAATEGNVRKNISDRRFVHLAAHATVDQKFGNLLGAIALTPPTTVTLSEDDGFLWLSEIRNLSLPGCELVVLSSCETNVGGEQPLEAGSTLARAFLVAGARDVVCSQWSVDDEASAELIGEFFASLSLQLRQKESPNFARALRDARRSIRAQADWSSPYFWAPFVLVGPGSSDRR